MKVLYIIVSYHIYACIIQMRIIIYRRILFQIKRMEGAENRSVKSLFIYFKNCESNSFIKKIIFIHGGTRDRILKLKNNTHTQKDHIFRCIVHKSYQSKSFLLDTFHKHERTYI